MKVAQPARASYNHQEVVRSNPADQLCGVTTGFQLATVLEGSSPVNMGMCFGVYLGYMMPP